jgi:hypothetical protein
VAKDKRVEVLFELQQYKRLEDAAHRAGKSVGAMVREAVEQYVVRPSEEERQRAWERMLSGVYDIGPVGSPEQLKEEIARGMYERTVKSMGPEWSEEPDTTDAPN